MSWGRVTLWRGYHDGSVREAIREAWDTGRLLVLCPPGMASLSFLEHVPHDEIRLLGDWSGTPGPRPPQYRGGAPELPDTPVFGLFTTGTTREEPKLVLYSRRNVETSLEGILSFFDASRIDSIFCYPQPSHTFGLTLGYLLALWKGWRLVTGHGKYAHSHHESWLAMAGEGTLTLGTPTHFQDLVAFVRQRELRPRRTYSAILGGARVPAALWRDVRDVLAIEAPSIGYGATEACPGVTHLPPGREPAEDGEIGFSLPQLQVEIAQDHLRATGPSICLASCQSGRWDAGRSLVLSDSLKTRDDGVLVFTTRSDLVMNRGGEKFSLEQIEREVSTAQGISCVAVAVPDARLGEELGLVVTGTPDRAAIFTRLRERFGRAFDPSRLVTVARIPVNTNGKPDRAACRALIERLGYPVPARKLGGWVPHRPPMVWVRDVVWSDGDGGACRVDSSCAPRTPAKWVECLAQAYAFVQAAERYCRDETPPASLPRAFLAGVSDFQLGEQAQDDGDWLVNVRRLHTLGPLSLVEGEVLRADGTVLARGKLKLYCEPAS